MSFNLKLTKDELAKPAGSGASFIATSGLYEVIVLAAVEEVNENGAKGIGLYVDLGNDNKQMLYGAIPFATYDNQTQFDSNIKIFAGLCVLADVGIEGEIDTVEASLPIGKKGAAKDVQIVEGIEDVDVKMWVKVEYYRKRDGTIGDNKHVKAFFRPEDNASSDEIIRGEDFGKFYDKVKDKFTDVKYAGDLTKEDVNAMIEDRKNGGSGSASPKKEAKKTPPRSRFAK